MRTELNRRFLLAGIAGTAAVPLASCGTFGGAKVDPQTVLDKSIDLVRTFCGILPLASVMGAIIAGLAGAGPIEVIAAQAAHAFCDAIPPQVKAQVSARRSQLRAASAPPTSDGLQTFGVIVINGKTIPLQGYVAP